MRPSRLPPPRTRLTGIRGRAVTAANKTRWTAANFDRVLFGVALGNYSPTFATAIGNVDATADKMTAAVGSLAKQLAKQSGLDPSNPGVSNGRPKITPWEAEALDEEMDVGFLGARAFPPCHNHPVRH